MTDSRLQTIFIVLPTLSTSFLYLLGMAYHRGYLNAFGVHESLFPLAFSQALFYGFIALIRIAAGPLSVITLIAYFLLLAVIVAVLLISLPRVQHWISSGLAMLPQRRTLNVPSEADVVAGKIARICGCIFGVTTVLYVLARIAMLSASSGQEWAVKEIHSFKDKAGNYAILSSSSPLLPEPTRCKQIFCDQSHCAFWLGSGSLVLKHESIERVEMHNPRVEKMLGDKAAQHPSP